MNAKLVKELRELTGAGFLDCKKALDKADGDIDKAITELRKSGMSKAASRQSKAVAVEGKIIAIHSEDNKYGAILELNCETDFVTKSQKFVDFANNIQRIIVNDKPQNFDELMNSKYDDSNIKETLLDLTAKIGEKINIRRFEAISSIDETTFVFPYVHSVTSKIGTLISLSINDAEIAKSLSMHIVATNPTYTSKIDIPAEIIEREKDIAKAKMPPSKPADIVEKIVSGYVEKFAKEHCLLKQNFIKGQILFNKDISVEEFLNKSKASLYKFIRYEVGEGVEKKKTNFAEEVQEQIRGS